MVVAVELPDANGCSSFKFLQDMRHGHWHGPRECNKLRVFSRRACSAPEHNISSNNQGAPGNRPVPQNNSKEIGLAADPICNRSGRWQCEAGLVRRRGRRYVGRARVRSASQSYLVWRSGLIGGLPMYCARRGTVCVPRRYRARESGMRVQGIARSSRVCTAPAVGRRESA